MYQAILSLQTVQWNRLARDVFRVEPERLDPMTVLDRVRRRKQNMALSALKKSPATATDGRGSRWSGRLPGRSRKIVGAREGLLSTRMACDGLRLAGKFVLHYYSPWKVLNQ